MSRKNISLLVLLLVSGTILAKLSTKNKKSNINDNGCNRNIPSSNTAASKQKTLGQYANCCMRLPPGQQIVAVIKNKSRPGPPVWGKKFIDLIWGASFSHDGLGF